MNSADVFDVIIAGAGSVGTPSAYFMAKAGLKVLVIDPLPSTGQASNKHAIGGVRATHSDPAKIYLCAKSIDVLSSWQETTGDDIEWQRGGYSFVAYNPQVKSTLIDLLAVQKGLGLNIDWLDRNQFIDLVPDINPEGLLGGTFSPDDGSASPLKCSFSFYSQAEKMGARFHFNERILAVEAQGGRIQGVRTDAGSYACRFFLNAAGSWAGPLAATSGIDLPVKPDSHEAGITEAVQPLFSPMIVDIRERPGSANFYFYQHPSGKIIFCVTPNPQVWGIHDQDSSSFLPLACQRLVEIMPKLANCRVRRTWRGSYPMTPDGSPILGKVPGFEGYLLAVGMCGQGFMLGPGVASLMTSLVTDALTAEQNACLETLRLDRQFTGVEKLK